MECGFRVRSCGRGLIPARGEGGVSMDSPFGEIPARPSKGTSGTGSVHLSLWTRCFRSLACIVPVSSLRHPS